MSPFTNDMDDDEDLDKKDRYESNTGSPSPSVAEWLSTNKYASLAGICMVLHGAFDNRQDRGFNKCISHV